ncbi:hypothetical protein R3P38DRAFT_1550454 [Favolaschia claudopus]|uniref:Uncharacterized protein n=1 Tax=Favolaschia claudopus TaxID=2862362 RepID=A0AAW0AIA4_9AGAR
MILIFHPRAAHYYVSFCSLGAVVLKSDVRYCARCLALIIIAGAFHWELFKTNNCISRLINLIHANKTVGYVLQMLTINLSLFSINHLLFSALQYSEQDSERLLNTRQEVRLALIHSGLRYHQMSPPSDGMMITGRYQDREGKSLLNLLLPCTVVSCCALHCRKSTVNVSALALEVELLSGFLSASKICRWRENLLTSDHFASSSRQSPRLLDYLCAGERFDGVLGNRS